MQLRWYQYFVVLAASPEVCTAAHHTEAHIHVDAQVCVASKTIEGSLVCAEDRLILPWSQRNKKFICKLLRRLIYYDAVVSLIVCGAGSKTDK